MEEKMFDQMELLSNSDDEEGLLFFIDTHKELLKKDPIKFISYHISFYANKEDITKSLQVVEYYKSAPYISMEVEDFLNEMKEELEKLTKRKNNEYSLEDISRLIYSNNENAIVSGLHALSKKNIRNHMDMIKDFLLSNQASKYKSLALFILIEQRVNERIEVKKNNTLYSLNPSVMKLPFEDEKYQGLIEELEGLNENIDVIENAKEILNTVQIKAYPKSYIDDLNERICAKIFVNVAKKFMGLEEEFIVSSECNNDSNKNISVIIDEIIQEFNS